MRSNTGFDNKVRQYIINHHIQHFRNIDELTGNPCKYTIVHELFSGNHNRKRSFYVENCIYFLSEQSHQLVQGNFENSIKLLMNRLKENQIAAVKYYERLRLIINTFDIKQARYNWKCFFDNDCIGEIPIIKINEV